MPQEYLEVFKAKYNGKRFFEMENEEAKIAAREILKTCTLLTGWAIPVDYDSFVSLLAAELKQEYEHLTASEVVMAFKKHCQRVKNYALPFSILLFNQVMDYYAEQRGLANEYERKLEDAAAQKELLTHEQLEQLEYQNAEEAYQAYKDGTYDPLVSASGAFIFDTLFKSKFIDPALLNEFVGRGFSSLRKGLEKEKSDLLITADNSKNTNSAKAARIDEKLALLIQVESEVKKHALKYTFRYAVNNKLESFYVKE